MTTATTRLYVGQLADGADEEAVRRVVSDYADVVGVELVKDADGRSRGFGFVTLRAADAQKEAACLRELPGAFLAKLGRRARVERAAQKPGASAVPPQPAPQPAEPPKRQQQQQQQQQQQRRSREEEVPQPPQPPPPPLQPISPLKRMQLLQEDEEEEVEEEDAGEGEKEEDESGVQPLSVKKLKRRREKSKALHKKAQQKKRKRREAQQQQEDEQEDEQPEQKKGKGKTKKAAEPVAKMTVPWSQLLSSEAAATKTSSDGGESGSDGGFSFLGGNVSLPPMTAAVSKRAGSASAAAAIDPLPGGSLLSILSAPTAADAFHSSEEQSQQDWERTRRALAHDFKSKKRMVQRHARALLKRSKKPTN